MSIAASAGLPEKRTGDQVAVDHRRTGDCEREGALAGLGHSAEKGADALRDLERDGLLTRTAYDEMPPRVEYELTPLGLTLREPLTALGRWAEHHIEEVLVARDAYDQRSVGAVHG